MDINLVGWFAIRVPGESSWCPGTVNIWFMWAPAGHFVTDKFHGAASISQHMSFCNEYIAWNVSNPTQAHLVMTIETRRRLLAFLCGKGQYVYHPTHILHLSPVTFHMHQGSWNCHISWEFDLWLHKLIALVCCLCKMKLYADPMRLSAAEWPCTYICSWLSTS